MSFNNSKKLLLILFFLPVLISLLGPNLYSQKKDSSDYFAIGIYGGTYIGQKPLYGKNDYINSVAAELEYFKFTDLSFYFQTFYQFTGNDVSLIYRIYRPYLSEVKNPKTFRFNISFGGRYYLRDKIFNPFFQAGLSHETSYIGIHSYRRYYSFFGGWYDEFFENARYTYNLSVNLGAGLSVRASEKLRLELKYDVYKSITKTGDEFTGFSVLGGVKVRL